MLFLVLSCTFIQTYSATSPFNPHREMDKNFSPSCSSSQITYVEAEAVEFSRFRFRFHRERNASTASASTSLIYRLLCKILKYIFLLGKDSFR